MKGATTPPEAPWRDLFDEPTADSADELLANPARGLADILGDPPPVATDQELTERSPGAVEPSGRGKYSPETALQIIEHVRAGNTVTSTCQKYGMTRQTLRAWSKKYPEFGRELEKARLDGVDHMAEAMLELVKSEESPHRARVIFEAVKWLCSVGRPRKYSERLMLDVQQTLDVRGAVELADARRRAMLQRDPIDVESVEVSE